MRTGFVEDITNVKAFKAGMERLLGNPEGVPSMALVFSDPGYGKTRTLAWYVAHRPGIVVRAKALMNGRWLLHELVKELGEYPMHRTMDIFHQAVELLMKKRQPVFIDDVDHLCHDSRVIETLRDLHDLTDAPIVFIGMGMADKKLMRYRHLYDRFSEVVKFSPLTAPDIRAALRQKCEVEVTDDGVEAMAQGIDGKFRKLMYQMLKAERIARVNGLKKISAAEFGRR